MYISILIKTCYYKDIIYSLSMTLYYPHSFLGKIILNFVKNTWETNVANPEKINTPLGDNSVLFYYFHNDQMKAVFDRRKINNNIIYIYTL